MTQRNRVIVAISMAVLVVAVGLLIWAEMTGRISMFASEIEGENIPRGAIGCSSCSTCTNALGSVNNYAVLTNDIVIDRAGSCIEFRANNTTLDCQNHLIRYYGSVAQNQYVLMNNNSGLTLKNCIIESYLSGVSIGSVTGIELKNTSGSKIINNILAIRGGYGVFLGNSNNNVIKDNKFYNNKYAITLRNSSQNTIENNIDNPSQFSVNIYNGSSNNNIINNNFFSSIIMGNIEPVPGGTISQNNSLNNNTICNLLPNLNLPGIIVQNNISGTTGDNNKCAQALNYQDASSTEGDKCLLPCTAPKTIWDAITQVKQYQAYTRASDFSGWTSRVIVKGNTIIGDGSNTRAVLTGPLSGTEGTKIAKAYICERLSGSTCVSGSVRQITFNNNPTVLIDVGLGDDGQGNNVSSDIIKNQDGSGYQIKKDKDYLVSFFYNDPSNDRVVYWNSYQTGDVNNYFINRDVAGEENMRAKGGTETPASYLLTLKQIIQ